MDKDDLKLSVEQYIDKYLSEALVASEARYKHNLDLYNAGKLRKSDLDFIKHAYDLRKNLDKTSDYYHGQLLSISINYIDLFIRTYGEEMREDLEIFYPNLSKFFGFLKNDFSGFQPNWSPDGVGIVSAWNLRKSINNYFLNFEKEFVIYRVTKGKAGYYPIKDDDPRAKHAFLSKQYDWENIKLPVTIKQKIVKGKVAEEEIFFCD
jgi:hypothetical protein